MKTSSRKHLAIAVAVLNYVAFPVLAAQNKAPAANTDSYSVDQNKQLIVAAPGVLANDTDQNGDPLTAVLATNPSHGALTFNANGSFTYTPTTNFTGFDSFIYQASDGQALSGNATVFVTVNPGAFNHSPVVIDQSFNIGANIPGSLQLRGTDVDGDPLTIRIIQLPSHGTLAIFAGPSPLSVGYTPNLNFVGTDTFTYVANDGKTDSNVGTVSVIVLPALAINNVSVLEGNSVGNVATFTVTLVPPSPQIVTVNWTMVGQIAVANSDFIPGSGTLTFSPGVQQQTITVSIVGDLVFEPDETFFVRLLQPANAFLQSDTGTCTILNDDLPPMVSINNISVPEGNKTGNPATFTVTLSAPSSQIVTVNWATHDGTATASEPDYTAASGTLTFLPGMTNQTISVTIVHDFVVEPDETFQVRLLSASNASIAGTGIGTCTILNDEVVTIGVTEGIPPAAMVKVGERFTYGIKWTHPTRWRLLDTVDIRIIDDEDSVLNVRFDEAENTFSLFNPANGRFLHPDAPGGRTHFETDAAVMYLENSQVLGSGPTGPSVLLNLNLSFKPKAAGRVFRVEAFATDDDGNQQGFDQAGIIGVMRK